MFPLIVNSIKCVHFNSCKLGKQVSFNNITIFHNVLRCVASFPETYEKREEKILKVAIIGIPNSGKSTLINNLVERKVCATSSKVHTTKDMAKAIFVHDDTQIVFIDTPGIVSQREQKKFNLENKMVNAPKVSLKGADIVGVINDSSNHWVRDSLHPAIINILNEHTDIPSFLILNKIDVLKSKRKLLSTIHLLCNGMVAGKPIAEANNIMTRLKGKPRGYSNFSDVFMISALEGDGVDKIKNYLLSNAKPGKWLYPESRWTDQRREKLIVEAVRAKFMDYLQQEIPYNLITEIEYLEEKEDGRIVTLVCVTCISERIEKLIAGAGGGRLRQMTDSVRHDLVQMFHGPVSITISLRVNKRIVEDFIQ